MTTSGNTVYQLSRNDIILAAHKKMGIVAKGQDIETDDYTNGALQLNVLIAWLRTKGMPLWARKTYTFTPVLDTYSYNIGIGQTFNTVFPLKLLQAYRIDSPTNGARIQMDILPDYNFNILPQQNNTGSPIQITYQPLINYGILKVWPTPDAGSVTNDTITIVYTAPFEYFSAATDTMAFPEEWYNPLIYYLAVQLSPEWGIPLQDRQKLQSEAEMFLQGVLDFGAEESSIFLQPDWRGRWSK